MSALLATRAAYINLAEQALARGDLGAAKGFHVLVVQVTPAAPRPVLPPMPADRKRAYRIAEARDRAECERVSEPVETSNV